MHIYIHAKITKKDRLVAQWIQYSSFSLPIPPNIIHTLQLHSSLRRRVTATGLKISSQEDYLVASDKQNAK